MKSLKIARIVTVPEAFVHIKSLLKFLRTKQADVKLISSPGKYESVLMEECGLPVTHLPIARDIHPFADLLSLAKLIGLFRQQKFDVVHSSTPKAGLLVALAGIFSPRTVCIHTFTGQRWVTLEGWKRRLLKALDRLIIVLNDQCYADSTSQIQFLIDEGVAQKGEVVCIHQGSYGGIDIKKFDNRLLPQARENLLKELKLSASDIICLFVGRVTREKGIEELVKAFIQAKQKDARLKLVLVGPLEPQLDPLDSEVLHLIKTDPSIFSLGFQKAPERFFSAADLFCLPSYREGFGTVVLEAAACGLCTIGSKIPGLMDAVVDGETGILVPVKNVLALEAAILDLAKNEVKRQTLSQNARVRARRDFDSDFLAELQWQEYQRLLKMRSE